MSEGSSFAVTKLPSMMRATTRPVDRTRQRTGRASQREPVGDRSAGSGRIVAGLPPRWPHEPPRAGSRSRPSPVSASISPRGGVGQCADDSVGPGHSITILTPSSRSSKWSCDRPTACLTCSSFSSGPGEGRGGAHPPQTCRPASGASGPGRAPGPPGHRAEIGGSRAETGNGPWSSQLVPRGLDPSHGVPSGPARPDGPGPR